MKNTSGIAYRWLYLGVEISVRELESRLLMAYEALHRGYAVVLGRTNAVAARASLLPPGVYVHKSIGVEAAPKLFSAFRDAGSRSLAFDEEGLLIDDKESFIRYQTSAKSVNAVDSILCWGNYHADVLKEAYPTADTKLVALGHPRVDLLREAFFPLYKQRVQEYQSRYGRFILLNTNFAVGDHAHFGEDEMIAAWYKRGKLKNSTDEQQQRRRIAFKRNMSAAFHELTQEISRRYSSTNVVVRPHPSENRAKWELLAEQHQNLHVVFEGSVHPWLLAASVIVQNNCTTGLEGRLLGRHVVSYRPFQDKEWDSYLINAITEQAYTPREVFTSIDSALRADPNTFDALQGDAYTVAKYHIENLDGEFSVVRILDRIEQLGLPSGVLKKKSIKRGAGRARFRASLFRCAYKWPKTATLLLGTARVGRWRRKAIKSTRKFDSVPLEFVKNYMAELAAVRGGDVAFRLESLRDDICVMYPVPRAGENTTMFTPNS